MATNKNRVNNMKLIVQVFAGIILATVMATVASPIQSFLAPVVSKVRILNQTPTEDGNVIFDVAFTKNYDCKFISVNWYKDGHRLSLEFLEDRGTVPKSRPAGNQLAGSWKLYGVTQVEGTYATTTHECSPGLWQVISNFYP
jgi:hypothetical protein